MLPTAHKFLELNPTPICLGTADLGRTIDRKTSLSMLDAYLDLGGNFLDTAKVYADWLPGERSSSEKFIGEWMHLRGNRGRVILATKGAHPELESMNIPRLTRAEIESDLDASLSHLQTERIDLYWLHRDDPSRPVEDILTTLNDAVKAGKIRFFGCSNWHTERIRAANDYALRHGIQGFAADQPMWNMAVVDPQAIGDPTTVVMDNNLWNYHLDTQMPAIPYSSTANGLFQKLDRGKFTTLETIFPVAYRNPENPIRFERARQLAKQRGLTITQVVLGYLLSQPFPTRPIIGPKSLEQLKDSLSAASIHLDASTIAWILGE